MTGWVAFFSQSGKEIADLADKLGFWPDTIITNKGVEHFHSLDRRIFNQIKRVVILENRPSVEEYETVLQWCNNCLITLHGWLRIIPPEICEKYEIYNGHPGLISKYPQLKGKDPQVKAAAMRLESSGSVIHRVTAGVDEGPIVSSMEIDIKGLKLDDIFDRLRTTSILTWESFLREKLEVNA